MRPVITISLNGNAYQLEEEGYEALRAYLATAEARLADNPDRAEILADLEQAIAEKCDRRLSPHKSVVTAGEVGEVIREMGPVDGSGGTAPGAAGDAGTSGAPGAGGSDAPRGSAGPHKRLYQIREGAMLSGVCNGIAAYFDCDVTIVRVIFVALAIITWGVWVLAYLVMMFVIPYAHTSEQHAAAHGWTFNAEELIDRAKRHYAEFKDGRQWRRRARAQRRYDRYCERQFRARARQFGRGQRWQGWHPESPGTPPAWDGQAVDAGYAAHILGGIVISIAALFGALLFIALVLAIGSLVATHAIFGWGLPRAIPLWAGIVILVVLYFAVTSPLHAAHRIGRYDPFLQSWTALWGTLLWMGFVILCGWLAWHHWPQVHHFVLQLQLYLERLGMGSQGTPV